MSNLSPFETVQIVALLTVPSAYRAWAYWVSENGGYGGLQVAQIRGADVEPARARIMLCEVFARATMEVAIGEHFDRIDSRVDVAVLMLIEELFGGAEAEAVYKAVRERGPVHTKRAD